MDRRALIASLEAEGLDVTEWTDDPGTTYDEHRHPHREVRIVLEGSMTMLLGDRRVVLGPGDRFDLEPGTPHGAEIGPDGVRYLAGSGR